MGMWGWQHRATEQGESICTHMSPVWVSVPKQGRQGIEQGVVPNVALELSGMKKTFPWGKWKVCRGTWCLSENRMKMTLRRLLSMWFQNPRQSEPE